MTLSCLSSLRKYCLTWCQVELWDYAGNGRFCTYLQYVYSGQVSTHSDVMQYVKAI